MRTPRPGLLFFALLAIGACDVGSVLGPGQGIDVPDGGDPGADAAETACVPEVLGVGNGNHNPGTACMTCHAAGGDGPTWVLAGTAFTSAAGTAPMVGATIVVLDANGTRFELPTATNGNFWTQQTIAFPVTVEASQCPDSLAMVAQSASGDCNSAGCHSVGSSSGRIHLP
jgi:hypothetical protein